MIIELLRSIGWYLKEDKYIATYRLLSNNTSNLDKNRMQFKFRGDDDIKSIKVILSEISITQIKFIEEYLNLTPMMVQDDLGITVSSYNNQINGELSLSTKLMWQLDKLFRVHLELIIDIPLYIDAFGSDII